MGGHVVGSSVAGVGAHLDRMGERAVRRPRPRFGIALAGVGAGLVLFGVLVWAGERAVGYRGEYSPDPDNTLGVVVSLVVVALGCALLVRFRRGPLATVGVVASVLGVPMLLGFATFNPYRYEVMSDGSSIGMPFALDVVVLLSLTTWLVSFVALPAAQGRSFYVASSAFILWLYVLEKLQGGAILYLGSLPWRAVYYPFVFGGVPAIFPDPDKAKIGVLSLLFGTAYYSIAAVLDRRGRPGLATPITIAAFVATALGLGHLIPHPNSAAGTGILMIVIGSVLAAYGATQGRRFTTWAWSAGIGLGVVLVANDIFEDTKAGLGVSAIVVGGGLVVLAQLVTRHYDEPDEMDSAPSRFTRRHPSDSDAPRVTS